jgi:hypothetical protein
MGHRLSGNVDNIIWGEKQTRLQKDFNIQIEIFKLKKDLRMRNLRKIEKSRCKAKIFIFTLTS